MFEESPWSCQYTYLYHNAAILAELFAFYENPVKQLSDSLTMNQKFEKDTDTYPYFC